MVERDREWREMKRDEERERERDHTWMDERDREERQVKRERTHMICMREIESGER